jgi:hypothetical protein
VVARGLTVAAIALASAAGIGGCGDEYSRGAGVYSNTTTTATATGTTTTQTTPAPLQTTDSGGKESPETARLSAAQRQAVRDASAAARRFLDGYLPYSYGRGKAEAISSTTPALRNTLAKNAPRVPPALAAKARPRLLGQPTVSGIAGGRVILLARIDDGQSRYVALLTVQRRGSQWVVTQVQ